MFVLYDFGEKMLFWLFSEEIHEISIFYYVCSNMKWIHKQILSSCERISMFETFVRIAVLFWPFWLSILTIHVFWQKTTFMKFQHFIDSNMEFIRKHMWFSHGGIPDKVQFTTHLHVRKPQRKHDASNNSYATMMMIITTKMMMMMMMMMPRRARVWWWWGWWWRWWWRRWWYWISEWGGWRWWRQWCWWWWSWW